MTPDPPLPRGIHNPYVQWGDCAKCGGRFPMTQRMIDKANPALFVHWERPICSTCRAVVTKRKEKRREKKPKRPACVVAGKVSFAQMKKMHLRQAPASGVPRFCAMSNRFFLNYFIGASRAVADERRAYLEAATEDEAIEEARDWYVRALLNGAKWLPDEFKAENEVNPEIERTQKVLRILRNRARRKRPPRKVRVKLHRVQVWVNRYSVRYNGKVVKRGVETREAATEFAEALRKKVGKKASEPLPLPCTKCGVRPVWIGTHLVHEGDDYCANMVMVRDKKISRLSKLALWNQVLRHGDYGGWWDFRFEHVLMMDKIKKVIPERPKPVDPLEDFAP